MKELRNIKASNPARSMMDEGHAQIEVQLKTLKESIIGGKGLPTILESAESLIATVLEHFHQEEMILQAVGYQGLAKHRAAHELISEQMLQIKKGLEERQIQASLNLLKIHCASLREHSELEDSKYAGVIRSAAQSGILPPPKKSTEAEMLLGPRRSEHRSRLAG